MKNDVIIEIPAGTLAAMTPEQLKALQTNIVAEGMWETIRDPVRISGGDYLGLTLGGMFIGIETDGYTHT